MSPHLLKKLNQCIAYHADNAKHFMARFGEEHDKHSELKSACLKLSKYHYKMARALEEIMETSK